MTTTPRPVNKVPPTITGIPRVGVTLTAHPGTWYSETPPPVPVTRPTITGAPRAGDTLTLQDGTWQ